MKVFSDALKILPPRHKVRSQLMLLMFFAEMLTPDRIKEIMKERLDELEHWTKVCVDWEGSEKNTQAGSGPHFLVNYAISMMEAEVNFLKKKYRQSCSIN